MDAIRAENGQLVTPEMIDGWSSALDDDRWPAGEKNVGKVIVGRPPLSTEGSAVLSVKIPPAIKRAYEQEAKDEGITTSELVRSVLVSRLLT